MSDCNHKLPSIASDHNIVIANVQWRLRNNKCVVKSKKDIPTILSNTDVRKQVVEKILCNSNRIGTKYTTFSEVTSEAILADVPNILKCKKVLPWEDKEVQTLRSTYRQAQLSHRCGVSVASKELYLRLSKELATLYVCKQEAYLITSCEEIMKLHDQDHQSKAVWRAIGDISGKRRSSDNPVIAAEDSAERGRLWQLHFSKLLGAVSVDTTESIDELPTGVHSAFNHCRFRVDMFDLDELTSAVESMCCGKACGLDNMVTEVLKLTELHPLLLGILKIPFLFTKTLTVSCSTRLCLILPTAAVM